jgi:formamidopyrimidine-DNA glycosylase
MAEPHRRATIRRCSHPLPVPWARGPRRSEPLRVSIDPGGHQSQDCASLLAVRWLQPVPELPEVETVRRGLERQTQGMTIARVDVRRARAVAFPPDPSVFCLALSGSIIAGWRRRGKYLLAELRDQDGQGAGVWGVHLRMTGQFLWIAAPAQPAPATAGECASATGPPLPQRKRRRASSQERPESQTSGAVEPKSMTKSEGEALTMTEPGPHTRVRFWSNAGDELRFIDTRSFAQMWWVPPNRPIEQVITGLARLGPEPFDPAFSATHLQQRLRGSSRTIKTALLDQTLVAGVGNIYADESLFAAGINPHTPAGSLGRPALERLRAALVEILQASIGAGGTTFSDFRDLTGTNGNYGGEASVYRRMGQPCRHCGAPIVRDRLAGRSTHWCRHCQR